MTGYEERRKSSGSNQASLAAKALRVLAAAEIEDYGATPPATSTPGRRTMAIGFIVMLLSVSAGMHFHLGAGGYGLLLCFVGVLVGTSLVATGPVPIVQVAFGGARVLAGFVRRNATAVGLVMASCAFTAVSGEEDPAFCFAMFVMLLLGVSLINIGARGE